MRDYQNMVFSTAYRLLADRAEAEDISQEVFLKAHAHFGDLRRSASVGGWLKTVTRNLCLSHLTRRRSRWRLFSEIGSDEDAGTSSFENSLPAADELTPALDTIDRREVLSAELDKLPPGQRVALGVAPLVHVEPVDMGAGNAPFFQEVDRPFVHSNGTNRQDEGNLFLLAARFGDLEGDLMAHHGVEAG